MKLIIDIPDIDYRHIREYYEKNDICEATYSYIYYGTPIPDNATNGDVVEKIFGKDVYCTLIRMMYSSCCEELKNWWNVPYQKGGKE